MLWQKFLLYGLLGMLIEVLFTGVSSLVGRNWKATGHTYLDMLPVYEATAIVLELVSEALPWPFWAKAFVYVPIIYGAEGLSGWAIKTFTGWLQRGFGGHGGGLILWDYGTSRWTPFGLINLKYAPWWLGLAMVFDPISTLLRCMVNFLASVS